jgi:hypothetical protein
LFATTTDACPRYQFGEVYDGVGPGVEELVVVADGEDPESRISFFCQDVYQRGGGSGVEHGGHLVADQVSGSLDEGTGEARSLELSVGDLMGLAVQ